MLVATLNAKHPTYRAELWAKYDALYRGGEDFRALLETFLPRNPEEPGQVYASRKQAAFYRSFVGPIVDYFAAKLFAAPLTVRSKGADADDAEDPFWASWKEDVTGSGDDLVDFMRTRLTSAFVKGRSWWLVELPELEDDAPAPVNRAQHAAMGLDHPYLCPLENEQVLDFAVDRRGELLWAIVHEIAYDRPDPRAPRSSIRETWRLYDRQNVETFEVVYDPTASVMPEAAKSLSVKPHGFARVPLVRCGFVGARGVRTKVGSRAISVTGDQLEGLWLVNRIADAQVEHFRGAQALSWNLKRTCYAMPVFKVADANNPPVMGAGYYIMIGKDEDAEWMAPPVAHLSIMAEEVASQKDEIYRLANQMANGVDNNAAAVGRSGESKAVDDANAAVCLSVYGAVVKEAIERTYQLVAEARGESVEWSIEGLDSFTVAAADVVDTAGKVEELAIPSPTLRKEIFGLVVSAVLPHVSQDTKDTIRREISDGVDEAEAKPEPDPTALLAAGAVAPGAPPAAAAAPPPETPAPAIAPT